MTGAAVSTCSSATCGAMGKTGAGGALSLRGTV
jgi:hypothetical protein